VCPAIASAIFIIGDDGLAENQLGDTVPDDLVALAKEAEESCPVQAIVVED
jgi:ferredoxin